MGQFAEIGCDPCDPQPGIPFVIDGEQIAWLTLSGGYWATFPIEPAWSRARSKAEWNERRAYLKRVYAEPRFPTLKGLL